jgi:hypothetical protein
MDEEIPEISVPRAARKILGMQAGYLESLQAIRGLPLGVERREPIREQLILELDDEARHDRH